MIAGAPAPTGRDLPACHHDPAVSAVSAGPLFHPVLGRWPRSQCDRPAHFVFSGREVLADQASRERANQEFLKEGSPFSANYRWSSKRLILSPGDICLQRNIQINQHNL